MLHTMARRARFIYIGLHEAVAQRIRATARSNNLRISALVANMLNHFYPEPHKAADESNDPIVITGQGEYQTIIRPSDL